MISIMELYLLIPIFAFVVSFFITHRVRVKNFEGSKLSRAYIGNFLWGFRTFLFPTISLFILLKYDLRAFCLSLLFFAVVNTLLRMAFPGDKRSGVVQRLGYLWYAFVALTLYLNDPLWIQIWPSLLWLILFLAAVAAGASGRTTQLTHKIYDSEAFSEKQIKIFNWSTPILSLLLICLNEVFRTQFSFETWAFYHAFNKPLFVLICGIGTVIFVPIFVREDVV